MRVSETPKGTATATRRRVDRSGGADLILLYGTAGCGKTWSVLKKCDSLVQQGWQGTLHAIDIDHGLERNLSLFSKELDDHIAYYDNLTFRDCENALAQTSREAKSGDWVLVELLGRIYDECQSQHVRDVFGESYEDYLKAMRKAKATAERDDRAPDLDVKEWTAITKAHTAFMSQVQQLAMRGVNVVCTAEAKEVEYQGKFADKREMQSLFGGVGFKPAGQKLNSHKFHTIIFLNKTGADVWHAWFPKNRGPQLPDADVPKGQSVLDLYQRLSAAM